MIRGFTPIASNNTLLERLIHEDKRQAGFSAVQGMSRYRSIARRLAENVYVWLKHCVVEDEDGECGVFVGDNDDVDVVGDGEDFVVVEPDAEGEPVALPVGVGDRGDEGGGIDAVEVA